MLCGVPQIDYMTLQSLVYGVLGNFGTRREVGGLPTQIRHAGIISESLVIHEIACDRALHLRGDVEARTSVGLSRW